MSKDYNIDNILSEVQKRREENEKEIKQRAEAQKNNAEEVIKVEPVKEEPPVEEVKPEPVAEEETKDDFVSAEEIESEEQDEIQPKDDMANQVYPDDNKKEVSKKQKSKMPTWKKVLIPIIAILLVLVIAATSVFFIIDSKLNNLVDTDQTVTMEEWKGMDSDYEVFDPIQETEASEIASLQDMIKTWYYNGTPVSSSKVLNVLLIGQDTRGTEILDEGTRADAAIIMSINAETQEITLTSILRDAYAYFETEPNSPESGTFNKINAAMSLGNRAQYIACVENLYKINIDNYVIVNFDSFESIVDTLGGVDLTLTTKEINEINKHPKRYRNTTIEKTFDGDSGKMTLNGKQALAYCRIRKIDSDNKRADRQKTTLVEIFKKARKAPKTKLLKIMEQLLPYVKTGFSKNEMYKIANYAIKQNWLDFGTVMTSVPEHNLKGGIYYGAWCWKCDYPQDAYNLQMKIYGKSNITLAHTRVDTAKCAEKGFYKDGSPAVSATVTNYNYGEVTTQEEKSSSKDEE